MAAGILHTLATGPDSTPFVSCLSLAQSQDTILLLGDGVYAFQGHVQAITAVRTAGTRVYALQNDCEARGVTVPKDVAVDIEGFVKLTEEHARQLAWY